MVPAKIVVDVDPGVGIPGVGADDALALLLALSDPRLELLAITTVFGNTPPGLGARGAGAVLAAAGRTGVPVAVGMDRPLSGRLPTPLSDAYAGERGKPGRVPLPSLLSVAVDTHAVDLIVRTVLSAPGEVTIVAIGPQTNLAAALLQSPQLRFALAGVVFAGGALGLDPAYGRGNVTPVAERNLWSDPWAADIVLNSGVPLTMVGLDVANPAKGVLLTADRLRSVAALEGFGAPGDLAGTLAVAVAADPGIAVLEPMALAVETAGALTTGQLVPVRDRDPNVRVCVDVDGPAFVESALRTILGPDG